MKIFWSWQSDNDEKCGRYFVRDVLEALAKELNSVDGTAEAERGDDVGPIAVDHDTKDVAGSPPIAETILEKIREAAVFVADVSPVGVTPAGKRLANPNVMIELGYAVRALGHRRIVLVMNRAANAQLDTLPFDLRHWRGPVVYELESNASPEIKREQKAKLRAALRSRIEPSLEFSAQAIREDMLNLNPTPKFRLELVAAEGELPETISQSLPNLNLPRVDDVKAKYPKLALPAYSDNKPYRPSAIARLYGPKPSIPISQWTREETERYNRRLEFYYAAYREYLDKFTDYHLFQRRTIEVKLRLINDGELPGTDIDVEVDIPEGMSLYEKDKPPVSPEAPKPPPLDPDPSATVMVSHQGLDLDWSSPKTSDRVWTNVEPDKRHVRFHIPRLKHGYSTSSDSFLLAFDTSDDIGSKELQFIVSAEECAKHYSDNLRVEIARVDD
ncbi:nucleotide-binding protein [Burkholderia sp. JSH-S8]|nr:nucleotide-binding protein [Burkholderia sp. JSH-S8]